MARPQSRFRKQVGTELLSWKCKFCNLLKVESSSGSGESYLIINKRANLHVSILALSGVPGEPHGVGLHVGHAELAHPHGRAQHGALQGTSARHCFILEKYIYWVLHTLSVLQVVFCQLG